MLNATADEEVAVAAAANAALNDATNGGKPSLAARKSSAAAKRARHGAGKPSDGKAAAGHLPNGVQAVKEGMQALQPEEGPLLQGFHFLAEEDAREDLLYALKPVFVILYDLDLAWIRHLEVYQSLHPHRPLKVSCVLTGSC